MFGEDVSEPEKEIGYRRFFLLTSTLTRPIIQLLQMNWYWQRRQTTNWIFPFLILNTWQLIPWATREPLSAATHGSVAAGLNFQRLDFHILTQIASSGAWLPTLINDYGHPGHPSTILTPNRLNIFLSNDSAFFIQKL